jgi:hypothetical protein
MPSTSSTISPRLVLLFASLPFAMGLNCVSSRGAPTGTGGDAGRGPKPDAGMDAALGTDAAPGGGAGENADAAAGGRAGSGVDAATGGSAGAAAGGASPDSGVADDHGGIAGSPVDAGAGDHPSSGGTCVAAPDTIWAPNSPPDPVFSLFSIGPDDLLGLGTQLLRWNGATWTVVPQQPPHLGNLAASGDQDVWIFQIPGSSGSSITRWNGTTWVDASISLPSGAKVLSVWPSGTNEAWLVASLALPIGPDKILHMQPAIYHWGGTAWAATASPLDSMPDAVAAITWSSGPNDVWGSEGTQILHWNGSVWAATTLAAVGPATGAGTLWGISPTDIWAVGVLAGEAAMWHFDGTTWTASSSTFSGEFIAVWGSCSADVWAVLRSDQNGAVPLWHFDGTAWSPFPIAGSVSPGDQITGTGPDDVWMTSGTDTTLLHRTDGFCGDGAIGPGEQCDPPHVGPDGLQCGSNCQLLTCGNGVVDPGEQCDPPESTGTMPCTQSCQLPTCGNGVIDPGEQCEPPNTSVCDSQCQNIPIVCGNGIVQPGETCDFTSGRFCINCQVTTCGQCFFANVSNDLQHMHTDNSDPACQTLSGTARTTCQALLNCMSSGSSCVGNATPPNANTACYCSDATCSSGANGVCAAQFNAVAGTTDTTVVVGLLNDATSLLSQVRSEAAAFGRSSCGPLCLSL